MGRFYSFVLLLFLHPAIMAQMPLTISGSVTDTAGHPLQAASIRITGSGTGTLTNNAGLFSLKVSPAHTRDTLLISYLGFSEQHIAIAAVPASGKLNVQLHQRIQDLREVVVMLPDATALIRDAIARIPANYYNKPHITHGFYRIDTKKGDEHIMLSEAVFDICNYGYGAGRSNTFRLLKMRSIQDEQASHNIDLGLKPKSLYEYDIVSDISKCELLNKNGLKNHRFRTRGIVTLDGSQAWHISFDQQEDVRESLFTGSLYLEVNTLAFMAIRYGLSPRGLQYAKYGTGAERTLLKLMGMDIDVTRDYKDITYQQYGDKWVLAAVHNDNTLRFTSNRAFYDFPADIRVDYIVTGVDTAGIASFTSQETLGNNRFIEQQEKVAVPDFWKDYNILLADYNSDTIAAAINARNESHNQRKILEARLKKLPKDPAARIDSIMSWYHRQGSFNGTLLVKHKGQVILRKGYGMADRENNVPAADTTQYRIGSLTKTFTSMLIQQLAEEKKLHLSDSIGRYLPGYVHGRVTIEQLLTHTSGIPNYTNNAEAVSAVFTGDHTIIELLTRYGRDTLEFTPGARFRYSNTGYLALAAIIEKATGKPYGDVLHERITGPLGMQHTVFGKAALNSKGYWMNAPEPVYNPSNMAGAGGIASTVNDLLLWDEALYTSQLLPQARLQQSMEQHANYDDWDAWYGYGWMIDRKLFSASRHHRIIYHPGTDFGYYTMFVRQPDTNSLIILLSNAGDFPRFDLADLLLDAMN